MRGDITLELTSADIPGALGAFSQAGIILSDVVQVSELTVRMTVRRQDYGIVSGTAERRGETLRQIRRLGSYWKYRGILRHPVLILGILLLLTLTAWLPTRVLFIQVEGNTSVPTRLILEKAAQCGIVFGAERGEVRSEKMKNALLEAVPQLQWAGINTRGCVAVITVEERRVQKQEVKPVTGSIVAVCDGVIRECTVIRGTALCKPGQAVREGETLISGYTDCGGVILREAAEGEVYAETRREIMALTPEKWTFRGEILSAATKYSLILGKNRINFYEDSGILDSSCVKMYSEYYMTLPGGLQLPVILVREEWTWYSQSEKTVDTGSTGQILLEYAQDYLRSRMVAGQILERQEAVDGCTLYAEYICLEMIGQVRYEEITENYGENSGENG